ncbi:protein GRAVITROPIC IN THE LIGHT 1-like [Punica granatum]|uniref:Uncharacterized protein n=2 Tax=Punica granatum TaxID=22663 RepID=A0A218X8Z9_PUNGR|nr:protein GRAVITROPIC IN THE LIGHT 1-like [Punica granatum]XP_031372314.1 protein GRAVITROPIC IN THE LIGHT 1-like [Punica granatum]XP_031372322.1 protein GRAVITROPIC IN THE LIGHT 1-like [Punica granatum]OWM81437.1 hypothetical protein CDL15_Pgr007475 [Punica granatum]PKI56248.1 hypothetical protein CRG98_023267 [Punica granatum]
MDTVRQSSVTPSSKSKLARTFAKVLHIRVATGVAPVDGIKKVKPQLKVKEDQLKSDLNKSNNHSLSFEENEVDELIRKREALEALLAKIFASLSTVKANYAQLQFSQSPYDADGIQSADQLIVSELKNLSELKQCFVKNQLDMPPETTLLMAEIQEQKSLLKTYEIMGKKMEFQFKLKDSEITFLKEKLEELNRENRSLEKSLNQSGPLSVLNNLHLSGLGPTHFVTVLRHTMKSMRSFVRLLIDEMKSADWDIDAAASAIEPRVTYSRADHKCFAFESYACREMFEAFQFPNFSLPNESLPEKSRRKQLFFDRFVELKSLKPKEYLTMKPRSAFAKFCRVKYLKLIHPKMESAFFGNLNQRNLVNSGGFPETTFFAMFAEVAKRVWLLHCLAFSFEPEAAIFQVARGCRFSEVYMETVAEEVIENGSDYDPRVAFTVVPGFKIGRAVIQCQVYLVNSRLR